VRLTVILLEGAAIIGRSPSPVTALRCAVFCWLPII